LSSPSQWAHNLATFEAADAVCYIGRSFASEIAVPTQFLRVTNQTKQQVLCARCAVARTLLTRVRGLLGRTGLDDDEGLLIEPCPSIHMFGMKFPLDVVFITRENVVTDFVENIAPGKAYVAKANAGKARSAIELPVGTIAATSTQIGDQLLFEEPPAAGDAS
jgi:uncharacterized membrane protein (UPF0127 family)